MEIGRNGCETVRLWEVFLRTSKRISLATARTREAGFAREFRGRQPRALRFGEVGFFLLGVGCGAGMTMEGSYGVLQAGTGSSTPLPHGWAGLVNIG